MQGNEHAVPAKRNKRSLLDKIIHPFRQVKKNKTIITCAITGSIHTPSMSPHLPVTPDDIAHQAIEAAEAGASAGVAAGAEAEVATQRPPNPRSNFWLWPQPRTAGLLATTSPRYKDPQSWEKPLRTPR